MYELRDYLNAINFTKDKLSQAKLKNLEYVKEYYGYSNEKAKTALNILREDQIEHIKNALKKGGRTK